MPPPAMTTRAAHVGSTGGPAPVGRGAWPRSRSMPVNPNSRSRGGGGWPAITGPAAVRWQNWRAASQSCPPRADVKLWWQQWREHATSSGSKRWPACGRWSRRPRNRQGSFVGAHRGQRVEHVGHGDDARRLQRMCSPARGLRVAAAVPFFMVCQATEAPGAARRRVLADDPAPISGWRRMVAHSGAAAGRALQHGVRNADLAHVVHGARR